jgi:pimeloyl-ACP methyl ester carboxylesterase
VLTSYQRLRNQRPRFGQKYNIIGFDPRGVGNSGPSLNCFASVPQAGVSYWDRIDREDEFQWRTGPWLGVDDNMNNSPEIETGEKCYREGEGRLGHLPRELAQAEAMGKFCSKVYQGMDARYGGTVAVAQDMMHFLKLRATELKRDANNVAINFYGASYGTILGSTFAALYPSKVRRMVLDGVVDVKQWYSGRGFGDFSQTEKCVDSFFETCYAAGTKCAFKKQSKSPAEIKKRFENILADLDAFPILIADPAQVDIPSTFTLEKALGVIFDSLYAPRKSFPPLALILESLERRDLSAFMKKKNPSSGRPLPPHPPQTPPLIKQNMANLVIPVIDANGRYNITDLEMWKHYITTTKSSKYHTMKWIQGPPLQRALDLKAPKSQVLDCKIARLSSSPNPHSQSSSY